MTYKVATFALVALIIPAAAQAETCTILNTGTSSQWMDVKVYDEDTGQVVLQTRLNGGESRTVTVSGTRLRYEYKLAGDSNYHSNTGDDCRNGRTVRM